MQKRSQSNAPIIAQLRQLYDMTIRIKNLLDLFKTSVPVYVILQIRIYGIKHPNTLFRILFIEIC